MNSRAEARWFPIRGSRQDARALLFCLPHAGAGAAAYRGWRKEFDPSVELVPVNPPGRENRLSEPAERSMMRLAEQLAGPLAERARGLPFAVFGHSMGALLGYEVASLLCDAGRPPVLLVVSATSAPQLELGPHKPVHTMPESELVAHVEELAGTPHGMLSDEDLRRMVVPALRADFAACETYTHRDRPPLEVPLLVLGGDNDPSVPVWSLEPWRERTAAGAELRIFPGDHFFHHRNGPSVLRLIGRRLSEHLSGKEPHMRQDEVLTTLAAFWRDVLVTEVRPETDFFEEGGQSVAALQVVGRVEEHFGVELSIRDIFESPTLEEFAEVVRAKVAR